MGRAETQSYRRIQPGCLDTLRGSPQPGASKLKVLPWLSPLAPPLPTPHPGTDSPASVSLHLMPTSLHGRRATRSGSLLGYCLSGQLKIGQRGRIGYITSFWKQEKTDTVCTHKRKIPARSHTRQVGPSWASRGHTRPLIHLGLHSPQWLLVGSWVQTYSHTAVPRRDEDSVPKPLSRACAREHLKVAVAAAWPQDQPHHCVSARAEAAEQGSLKDKE